MPSINQPTPEIPDNSAIKTSKLNNFLSALFGWRRTPSHGVANHKVDFVKVDVDSDQKVGQALANYTLKSNAFSEKLDTLFNNWMTDNTDKSLEIQNRKNRVDQLEYAVLNEPILGRTVDMFADEACQLDSQETILSIETPDPRMTRDMYKLLSQWGVTQTRIRETIRQLAIYGDAFWSNKITENGVERVIPLRQLQVTDRLEFNPVDAMEKMKRKNGTFNTFASSNYLIDKMLDTMEDNRDLADMFDTKLFGYSLSSDLVVPPWSITHFRVGADSSEFAPFGTSPIIGTLAPFKQIQSTIALQSLARVMSFPVQLYKVKTSDSMDEGRQFGVVNRVREAYDNIGVSPANGSSEVYTVNTKVWLPDNLVTVETVSPNIETGDIDDLKLYQDRLAVAAGIPKSFFSDEFFEGGSVNSGKALTQQYKPFGRKVYSLQTAFLESLADLFRIHFAVTGQYDFRIPFTISMKYPAIEEDDDHLASKKGSLELADDVMTLIKNTIGAEEDEALPPDIIRDIIGKYTFLDPADIVKWTSDAKYNSFINKASDADSEDEDSDSEFNLDDTDSEEPSGPEELDLDISESRKASTKQKRLREKVLRENYSKSKTELYFKTLEEFVIGDFNRGQQHIHVCNTIASSLQPMLEALNDEHQSERFQEGFKY